MKAGFVIANSKEEYLIKAYFESDSFSLLWSNHPSNALIWSAYKYARIVADKIQTPGDKFYVLQMIETEQTCFVTVPPGRTVKGPEWLKAA